MKLKNYTSGVPAAKTISRIEEILADMGALTIGKNYKDGKVASITFQLLLNGRYHLVRLPADPVAVYDVMLAEIKKPQASTQMRIAQQAERTAWKIQQDWLEVELALIRLNQKEPLETFLSYLWDGEATYFDRIKEAGFKQLPESCP